MAGKIGFFYDELFLQHDTGPGHPETARRLSAIHDRLQQQSYFGQLAMLAPRRASVEELSLCHEPDYINAARQFCTKGGGRLDADTVVSGESYRAAELAAGAGLQAADAMLSGTIDRAFLLLRPPGHHSLRSSSMGFCLFNNIAITARYLREKGLQRVAIIDWDVHHGNGTEAEFYEDPSVLFISTHQYPFYPGSGAAEDCGRGPGLGATLNVPMARGSGDADFRQAFGEQILPALDNFAPEALLISAGFDAHERDPLAALELKSSSYEWMTHRLREIAERHARGRMLSFLEGGYDLPALAESAEAHCAALL
ncbi:MAG: histone deacetylase [Leptospirales bacterium]|nr:histone deacetylase [Leptospirales bacterium]